MNRSQQQRPPFKSFEELGFDPNAATLPKGAEYSCDPAVSVNDDLALLFRDPELRAKLARAVEKADQAARV